jgi:hypothetical protein
MRDFYREQLGVSTWPFFYANLLLLIGVMGQAGLYGPFVLKYFSTSIIGFVFIGFVFALPWLALFVVTYLKQPILPPRPFRLLLLSVMGWYALFTLLAEILNFFGYMPPESARYAFRLLRVLMYVGWLSFIPLVYSYIAVHRHELRRGSDNQT